MLMRLPAQLSSLFGLYSLQYPQRLITMLAQADNNGWRFLGRYWRTKDFSKLSVLKLNQLGPMQWLLLAWLVTGILCEIGFGLLIVSLWLNIGLAGGLELGLAAIIAYPVVWAHLLALTALGGSMSSIKQVGRILICAILERQVISLRKRYQFCVVAVTGSVGKTSTKLAIAKVLAADKRVIYQEGNYNDRVTVPLVLFGADKPAALYNLLAWARAFLHNQRVIRRGYPYDIAVLELGTDHPGQIAEFRYLHPDIAVVTAVAPEHMEYFVTLEAVAHEELEIAGFSERLLINGDDVDERFAAYLKDYAAYGLLADRTYRATYAQSEALDGEQVAFHLSGSKQVKARIPYVGAQGVKAALAAVAVADMLSIDISKIIPALEGLTPFAGRMQILQGLDNTTLIDDTYNASPIAVRAALDVLYAVKAPKKIVLLGSMNELGESSRKAHNEVGKYCDPKQLAVVATLGVEANKYLAPAARERGCRVIEFVNPYEAGAWAAGELVKGTVLLAKGSQNGVFAEEALKPLLARPEDRAKLVRQSPYWMDVKQRQFGAH